MKWPIKVMWNKFRKYEQVRSFKTFDEACVFMDEHPDQGMEMYIRLDLVRFR